MNYYTSTITQGERIMLKVKKFLKIALMVLISLQVQAGTETCEESTEIRGLPLNHCLLIEAMEDIVYRCRIEKIYDLRNHLRKSFG